MWRPTPGRGQKPVSAPPGIPERRAAQYVVEDDHESIEPGDRSVLILENDANFAKVLLNMAREKGFKGVVCLDGDSGLAAAHEYRPDAITLDIDMPGLDGWKVLERLKHHPATRHIPVHIISGIERRQQVGGLVPDPPRRLLPVGGEPDQGRVHRGAAVTAA